jgi:hypothetical protein
MRSDWKPVGLEDIPDFHSDEVLNRRICEHLHISEGAETQRIAKQLRNRLGRLWLALHYRGRPTGGSSLAALAGKAEGLRKIVEEFRALDTDTRRLLEARAAEDEMFSEEFPPEDWLAQDLVASSDWAKGVTSVSYHDRQGDVRYTSVLQGMSRLAGWIDEARASIELSKPGRTKEAAELTAIIAFRNIMRDAFGRDPTRKELTAFVDDLFAPLWKMGLLQGTMAGHINQALYVCP